MRRFFIEPGAIKDDRLQMTGPEVHHLANVLRLKIGDNICLYDGTGNIYHADILRISSRVVELAISSHGQEKISGPALFLGQGLVTGKKMDLIIQKTTELGISGITPFICQYGSVRRQSSARLERWQKIALAACKQCGRATAPQITAPVDITTLLMDHSYTDKIIFWENEEQTSLAQLAQPKKEAENAKILFMIGPEGGFSSTEIQQAKQQGFMSASLGQRVLRTETAAISTTAILQYIFGNLDIGEK